MGTLVLTLAIASLLTQIAFWVVAQSLWRHAESESRPASNNPGLSVVVAARDEEQRLPELLDSLLRQTYHPFEVVVVDDGSVDGTSTVIQHFSDRDSRVRLVRLNENTDRGKRGALEAGILAAKFDLLAMTDADCRPPAGWIAAIAASHRAHPDTVFVGYGPMITEPHLLNRLARFETLMSSVLTRFGIRLGIPFMAVGRNLSYPRSVFVAAGGFGDSGQLKSGDDDLFIQRVVDAGAGSIRYLDDPETFVPSQAPSSWAGWINQKRRHHSAGRGYRLLPAVFLAGFHFSSLILWLAPIAMGPVGLALLGGKIVVHTTSLAHIAGRMEEKGLSRHTPYLDLLYVLYVALVGTWGLLFPPKRW